MRVIFVSNWALNPYQELLVKHLRKFDIETDTNNNKVLFKLKSLKQLAPDILHLQLTGGVFIYNKFITQRCLHLLKLLSELFIARQKGIKIICTIHDATRIKNPENTLHRIVDKILIKLCDKIIVHSYTEKIDFIKFFKLKEADISVIPHGNYIECYENKITREEARKILDIQNSNFVILFFGWLFPYKGLLELVEAFISLHQDRAVLMIAGKTSDNQDYIELIKKKIGNFSNIKLNPTFIPNDQVQTYMNSCDIVATPYVKCTTSGVAVLAMSFGKPCIAPRMGFFKEVLDDKGAFLYDPSSRHGLLQAISSAIQSEKDLPDMGRHNQAVIKKWNWDRIAEMTADLYRQTLSE